jgi:hypothetical protein
MLIPAIRTGIEEGHDPSSASIHQFGACLLVAVALGAATAEIAAFIPSTT